MCGSLQYLQACVTLSAKYSLVYSSLAARSAGHTAMHHTLAHDCCHAPHEQDTHRLRKSQDATTSSRERQRVLLRSRGTGAWLHAGRDVVWVRFRHPERCEVVSPLVSRARVPHGASGACDYCTWHADVNRGCRSSISRMHLCSNQACLPTAPIAEIEEWRGAVRVVLAVAC